MKDTIREHAAIFAALADPTRLQLFQLICNQQEPEALCVNALVSLLGVSQSAVSQHLRVLKSAGLIKSDRRGYYVHYSVDPITIERFKGTVSEILTPRKQNQDEVCRDCVSGKRS